MDCVHISEKQGHHMLPLTSKGEPGKGHVLCSCFCPPPPVNVTDIGQQACKQAACDPNSRARILETQPPVNGVGMGSGVAPQARLGLSRSVAGAKTSVRHRVPWIRIERFHILSFKSVFKTNGIHIHVCIQIWHIIISDMAQCSLHSLNSHPHPWNTCKQTGVMAAYLPIKHWGEGVASTPCCRLSSMESGKDSIPCRVQFLEQSHFLGVLQYCFVLKGTDII